MDIQQIDLEFLSIYPNGFNDELFLMELKRFDEHKIKVFFQNELSSKSLKSHIEKNTTSELIKPVISVISKTWITSRFEKIAFRNFMMIEETNEAFFLLLYEILYGELEQNFDAFVALLKTHHEVVECSNSAKWPIVSFFMVYSKYNYYPVKPNTTKKIAQKLGYNIKYKPLPNLETYNLINKMYNDFLLKTTVAKTKSEADIELYVVLK